MICFNCYNEENFEQKEEIKKYIINNTIIAIKAQNTYCEECGTQVYNHLLEQNNLKDAYKKYKEINKKSDSDFYEKECS